MTDADLSREEWIDERIAILVHMAGVPEDEAKKAAERQWQHWVAERKSVEQRA